MKLCKLGLGFGLIVTTIERTTHMCIVLGIVTRIQMQFNTFPSSFWRVINFYITLQSCISTKFDLTTILKRGPPRVHSVYVSEMPRVLFVCAT
jgi:hypothetical protein